ncbi:MAG: hypothetical protein AB8C02_18245 [Halioglobus sp.]
MHIEPSQLPASLQGWIAVEEVEQGHLFAGELFRRKYQAGPPPDHGRHIVAVYRDEEGAMHTLSYLHFWRQDRIGLIGGGCTDGNVIRAMPIERAQAINAAGGMLRQTLLFAFTRFAGEIDAFFGHAGDKRAREVDLLAGFEETEDQYLLINPVGELTAERRQQLTEQALAIGVF